MGGIIGLADIKATPLASFAESTVANYQSAPRPLGRFSCDQNRHLVVPLTPELATVEIAERPTTADLSRPIVIVGALPPPMNGYALITSKIVELARDRRKVVCFDISPGVAERGVRYHFNRIRRVAAALLRLIPARLGGANELYVATESRIGLLYTIALSLMGRVLGYHILLHHHVFRYIAIKSRLMTALVRITRYGATHIFLCDCMERDFRALYGESVASLRLSNAAFIAPPTKERHRTPAVESVRVGLLSNLTREKGLYQFLRLAEMSSATGTRARFVLAGPAGESADAEAIARLQRELPDRFEYRGPLYGEDQDQFYRDIDVFVFPTTYENEAQPLVLYEAMAQGCAILSYDRGCIAEQVGEAGWVIAQEKDFANEALQRISALIADRGSRRARARSARGSSRP
jgi:glycosyltransferase involved in cell wall biosynthesis